MQLDQLVCLVEVAKAGSFTAAAQHLHITLSAVSQSIANLENELGVTLFIRSRTGAAPTPEGQVLIKKAYEVVAKADELRAEATGYNNTQIGELRLAAFPGPLLLAMDAILDFKRDYPYIQFNIEEKGIDHILEDVRRNQSDLGLVLLSDQFQQKSAGLSIGRLLRGQMVIAVNRHSPIALSTSVKLEEIQHEGLVLYDEDYLKWFMERHQQELDPTNILFYTNNTSAIVKAVRDGLASTIGVDFSFWNEPSVQQGEIVLVKLEVDHSIPVDLGWVRAEGKHFPKASELFIQKLKYRLSQYRNS